MNRPPRSLRVASRIVALCAIFASVPMALAQEWAKAKLEASPRHREYVVVKHDGRAVTTYVVYPEVKEKAPIVVLIHEIFGLSDWMKLQSDELAAKGFIVLAPDLLSGMGPGGDGKSGGGSDALYASPGGQDAVIKAVMGLDGGQVNADLDAVADYGLKLPASNGNLAVGGFCWGGSSSFAFATHRQDLKAALVFYGTPPPAAEMVSIHAPVYGFYAQNDARVSSTLPQAIAAMKAAGKVYDPVTYAGAGHGFMRAGQAPDATPENKRAFDEGFARMEKILKHLKGS